MNNRRRANELSAVVAGVPKVRVSSGRHMPSKMDLFNVLDGVRFQEMPEEVEAREAMEAATKERKNFERHSKTWRRLRRAEQAAERELRRITPLAHDRRDDEIRECRTMLRLHGVTPMLVDRIELLVYGSEDV